MTFERKTGYTVERLVSAYTVGTLVRPDEYQRGAAWRARQQQAFVDSLFRGYPLPPLFLEMVEHSCHLDDTPTRQWKIIDGQQRILALKRFADGHFPLLSPEDKKLRIPNSLRSVEASWAGKLFDQLSTDLANQFRQRTIDVYEISKVEHRDIVRDLFIRLQSGTPLTRQQIRDAWPGNVGPFVWRLAGRMTKLPQEDLFGLVDRRGQRRNADDADDPYAVHREICAQLLWLFLNHERDPNTFVSLSADQLDMLYHEHTELDVESKTIRRFRETLECARKVLRGERAAGSKKIRPDDGGPFKRLDVVALVLFLQDVTKGGNFKLDDRGTDTLLHRLRQLPRPKGKGTSARTIREHYEEFRKSVETHDDDVGIRLDERRCFTDERKRQIKVKQEGKCAVCEQPVYDDDAEYDHWPVPWRDGGHTEVDNGRLVHRRCHPRGRPVDQDDEE